MSFFGVQKFEDVSEASAVLKKTKKSKKLKREKKDKSKCAETIVSYQTATLTQNPEMKKRKKSKKKKMRLEEDFQLLRQMRKTKSENQLQQLSRIHTGFSVDANQFQSVTFMSPDQVLKRSNKSGCYRRVEEKSKIKKRVVFNLPLERSQATDTDDEDLTIRNVYNSATSLPRAVCPGTVSQLKLLSGDKNLEPQTTAEETNSQDLFITQKSFLEPYVDLSSGSSGNETTAGPVQENRSRTSTSEASTQTENFFTCVEISSFLRFQQQKTTCSEEPVDLSLPSRTRQRQGLDLSAKPAMEFTNPFKLKTSDTSSEDGDLVTKTKADLSQLRVIQTRLNESFFFKVKGYDSPKPLCPLMKLTENVEKKTK